MRARNIVLDFIAVALPCAFVHLYAAPAFGGLRTLGQLDFTPHQSGNGSSDEIGFLVYLSIVTILTLEFSDTPKFGTAIGRLLAFQTVFITFPIVVFYSIASLTGRASETGFLRGLEVASWFSFVVIGTLTFAVRRALSTKRERKNAT